LAIIAGGGAAGLVQGTTVLARGLSTATTGGLRNPLFATIELTGSVFTSVMTFFVPVFGIILLALLATVFVRLMVRKFGKRSAAPPVMAG
jgi:hypothetical protein